MSNPLVYRMEYDWRDSRGIICSCGGIFDMEKIIEFFKIIDEEVKSIFAYVDWELKAVYSKDDGGWKRDV